MESSLFRTLFHYCLTHMSEKILFVDDDKNLLASLERTYKRRYQLETADSGAAGLIKLDNDGPYAVIVADRQMPGMDGIQFLAAVKQRAPSTVRMMLTGNADLEAAVRVVNEGNIFRFLTKPCPSEILCKALTDALAQYRLVQAEKDLLSKTLSGSIKLLTDILSLTETQSWGRTQSLRDFVTTLAGKLGLSNAWELHLAVMLAPVGYVTVPPETLVKFRARKRLAEVEDQIMQRIPETAGRLLANIPRLEGVAAIVRYQNKNFDGSGLPADKLSGDLIPLGARLLKIVLDLTQLESAGSNRLQALEQMEARSGWYDPKLLAMVRSCEEGTLQTPPKNVGRPVAVALKELRPGMVLRTNVETKTGMLIVTAGHELNEMTLEKLMNFARISGIQEPILIESSGLVGAEDLIGGSECGFPK